MIHVQEGALRPFEQDVGASLVGFVERPRDVCQHRADEGLG